jgi:peroxiredoxin
MATLTAGAQAPDFTLPGIDGRAYTLGEAARRGPVVLAFGKSDCPTCALAFPYLERLHQAYPHDRWQLLAILQDPTEDARAFAQAHALTFPVLAEPEPWPVSRAYDPEATPTIFAVEPGGRISRVSAGFQKRDLNGLSADLARQLEQEPVVVAPADDGKPAFRPG